MPAPAPRPASRQRLHDTRGFYVNLQRGTAAAPRTCTAPGAKPLRAAPRRISLLSSCSSASSCLRQSVSSAAAPSRWAGPAPGGGRPSPAGLCGAWGEHGQCWDGARSRGPRHSVPLRGRLERVPERNELEPASQKCWGETKPFDEDSGDYGNAWPLGTSARRCSPSDREAS